MRGIFQAPVHVVYPFLNILLNSVHITSLEWWIDDANLRPFKSSSVVRPQRESNAGPLTQKASA